MCLTQLLLPYHKIRKRVPIQYHLSKWLIQRGEPPSPSYGEERKTQLILYGHWTLLMDICWPDMLSGNVIFFISWSLSKTPLNKRCQAFKTHSCGTLLIFTLVGNSSSNLHHKLGANQMNDHVHLSVRPVHQVDDTARLDCEMSQRGPNLFATNKEVSALP